MAAPVTIQGEIVKEYIAKYPKMTRAALARKIYKENKLSFSNPEAVRTRIRYHVGQAGKHQRKRLVDKTLLDKKRSSSRYEFLPESHALTYEPYEIKQSRVLIISDLHFPYQHNEAIKLALDYGLKKKVNCILINGDLMDFANISRHERDWRHRSLQEEFEAARAFLSGLRKLFPKAKIVFKEGNHDERWEKFLYANAPEVFGDPEYRLDVRLRLAELKIDYVKDKLPVKIGRLTVLHGHELQGGGGVNPARATFLKTIDNVLIGHCHRTSTHLEKTLSDKVLAASSAGCLCGMYPMFARVNKWNLGFVYVDHEISNGEYVLYNKVIINGKVF